MLTKQEFLLGKGARVESRREGNPGELLCHVAHRLGFMVMGLVSGWSLANRSNSVFLGGTGIAQPRCMLARGILGSGWTPGVSF